MDSERKSNMLGKIMSIVSQIMSHEFRQKVNLHWLAAALLRVVRFDIDIRHGGVLVSPFNHFGSVSDFREPEDFQFPADLLSQRGMSADETKAISSVVSVGDPHIPNGDETFWGKEIDRTSYLVLISDKDLSSVDGYLIVSNLANTLRGKGLIHLRPISGVWILCRLLENDFEFKHLAEVFEEKEYWIPTTVVFNNKYFCWKLTASYSGSTLEGVWLDRSLPKNISLICALA